MHYFLKPKILCFSTMIDNALTRQRCERHKYQNAYFLPILLIKSLHNMHAACTTCTPLAKRNNYNNQQEQARKTKHKHCAHAINSSNFVIIFFTSFYRSDKNGSTKSCPTNPCNKHSPTFSPSLHSKSSRNSPITMRPIYTCGTGTRPPPQQVKNFPKIHHFTLNFQAPPPPPPSPNTSTRWLQNELQSLMKDPFEGFKIKCDEKNLHLWNIGIFGPPGTIYQGAYFKAVSLLPINEFGGKFATIQTLKFPNDCPYQPPEMRFSPPIYHPNVYEVSAFLVAVFPVNLANFRTAVSASPFCTRLAMTRPVAR